MIIPAVRTVIADDEHLVRKKLRALLGSESGVQVIAECQDGQQTIDTVKAHKPDLLLIDIKMPDLDGFQVLGQIAPEEMPIVVFTTERLTAGRRSSGEGEGIVDPGFSWIFAPNRRELTSPAVRCLKKLRIRAISSESFTRRSNRRVNSATIASISSTVLGGQYSSFGTFTRSCVIADVDSLCSVLLC
jgi:chemotaxis response regulator CheB